VRSEPGHALPHPGLRRGTSFPIEEAVETDESEDQDDPTLIT